MARFGEAGPQYKTDLQGTHKDYIERFKPARWGLTELYTEVKFDPIKTFGKVYQGKVYHCIMAGKTKIAVDLWDFKYKSILYILGFPPPFMEVNARKKLEDAMDAVISTASKVKSKGTPKLEFRYYLETGSQIIINLRREVIKDEIDDGSYVNIDLTDAVNGKQKFKEQFLDKVPHVQLQFGDKDSEDCIVSLIDISQPWTSKKSGERIARNNDPRRRYAAPRKRVSKTPGCKKLKYYEKKLLNNCSPCFISACESEPYYTRFKAWIEKITSSVPTKAGGGKRRRRQTRRRQTRRRQTRRRQTRKRKTRRKRN